MVLDAKGDVLGRIKTPLVDQETWLVDVLRVTPTRHVAAELALPWSWTNRPTVDVATGLVQAFGDAIILRVSLAEMREATPTSIDEPAGASIH
jgi:hypothetical protein